MDGCVFLPSGDCALTVEFGREISEEANGRVRALAQALKQAAIPGVVEWIPTFRSLLVCYDPGILSFRRLTWKLRRMVKNLGEAEHAGKRIIEIPVLYGGEYGEDLPFVAAHAGMSLEEIVSLHSSADYRIYMLGFLPGFAYLGGLDKHLHTPRLQSPRTKIPAGAIGIGGEQTGIYPMASPGGWQLIGLTPVKPYDPTRSQPILYSAGDYIRFVPVDETAFREIRRQVEAGTYVLTVREEAGV